MTSVKTKLAARIVWVSTWGFVFSVLFFILSLFMPQFRIFNWLLLALAFLALIIIGVAYHMGPILPDALNQGKDSMEIARKQKKEKKEK